MNVYVIRFCLGCVGFCFKQKTAYEVRISDWSSDVCSSDLWSSSLLPQNSGLQRSAILVVAACPLLCMARAKLRNVRNSTQFSCAERRAACLCCQTLVKYTIY